MEMITKLFKNNIRQYGMIIALVVIMLLFEVLTGGLLLKPINITNLILQNSYILVLAIGMVLVIITGHIDLSVGSIAAFVGAVAAIMMVDWQLPAWLAVIASLLVHVETHAGTLEETPDTYRHCRERVFGEVQLSPLVRRARQLIHEEYAEREPLVPAINKAIDADIPVVLFDADAPDSQAYSFLGTDNYKSGVMAADKMAELLESQQPLKKYPPTISLG